MGDMIIGTHGMIARERFIGAHIEGDMGDGRIVAVAEGGVEVVLSKGLADMDAAQKELQRLSSEPASRVGFEG